MDKLPNHQGDRLGDDPSPQGGICSALEEADEGMERAREEGGIAFEEDAGGGAAH